MACCLVSAKPLSEPMLTYCCQLDNPVPMVKKKEKKHHDSNARSILICPWLVEAGWCIYASMSYVTVVLDNGLSPNRSQATIKANADLLSVGHIETTSVKHAQESTGQHFHRGKRIWKCSLWSVGNFVSASKGQEDSWLGSHTKNHHWLRSSYL